MAIGSNEDAGEGPRSEHIMITTRDGNAPCEVAVPNGKGPWPAIIMFMDGLAIRPALVAMAARLASNGFVVLLPDLFYRAGAYRRPDPGRIATDVKAREEFRKLVATTDNLLAARDTEAFLAYLATRSDVLGSKVGTVGYCLGGGIALTVAGAFPDRIAAAASFHGGYLATDLPTSPHLSVPNILCPVLVVGATDDPSYPPEMAERLANALHEAGVRHRCATYAGAKHGWTMSDLPAFDEAAAEQHWSDLVALFADAFGQSTATKTVH